MIHGSAGLLVFFTWTLLRGDQGAMSDVPDQPFEQHNPRLAETTIQYQQNRLLRHFMSIILKQPSEEYTSEYESIGPQFFSQISKEEGDVRSSAVFDTYQHKMYRSRRMEVADHARASETFHVHHPKTTFRRVYFRV